MALTPHTTKNEITGDLIQGKQLSEQGRKNWDNIDWGRRAREEAEAEEQSNDDS